MRSCLSSFFKVREGFAKMLFQVLQSRAAGRKALLLGLFGRGDHRGMGRLLATGPVVGGRVGRRELDKARCVDGQLHGARLSRDIAPCTLLSTIRTTENAVTSDAALG